MSTNERPGVYTSYEVTSNLSAYGAGGAVGLAAAASSGTPGTVIALTSYAEAISAFGGGNLTELVRILLRNGAPLIYATAVSGNDYDSAFAALMDVSAVKYMVCDSRSATIHGKLQDAIENADENAKYRIGIVETALTERSALITAASAINSERMVMVSHCESSGTPGAVAAAVCGAASAENDPAVPLNGAVLYGLGELGSNFSDTDIGLLVRGGITPVETVAGEVSVVRGITTRSSSGGAPDATWRELTTIQIVDRVIPQIRDSLRARFSRAKNNTQTRGAIRTQVVIELEDKVEREFIDSYSDVTVEPDTEDPTICVVSFEFTVAHGLNRIELRARITV